MGFTFVPRACRLAAYKQARTKLIQGFEVQRAALILDDLDGISQRRLGCLDLLIAALPEPVDLMSAVDLFQKVDEMLEITIRFHQDQTVLTTGTEHNEEVAGRMYDLLDRTFMTMMRDPSA